MATAEPSLVLLHHSYGPYHLARARALRQAFPGAVHLVQLANAESLRAWRADQDELGVETAAAGILDELPAQLVGEGLERILDRISPGAIAIAGYGDPHMRRAAAWARRRGRRAVLLSDSQACDLPRRAWRERMKRYWVSRHFDRAFVSGATAAAYVESLGIRRHLIWRGYDVVDNQHFAAGASEARANGQRLRVELQLPERFFLYVGRFAPEKNLGRLIEAFAAGPGALPDWALVLVGGGPLEPALRAQAAPLGGRVRLVEFQQLARLPSYYGLAEALVLPSVSEPWGLVVNEAMAAGLPVVVSSQCGCAMELVFPGVNGAIVDPSDTAGLAATLGAIAASTEARRGYGLASARIVENFSVETWARALTDCALSPAGH
jgi:1,2-diacylglycerol 3-alpha-glucosyltransferase